MWGREGFPIGAQPPPTSLRVRGFDRSVTPRTVAMQVDPFQAGIRALYGQLCTCSSRGGGRLRSLGVISCYDNEGTSTVASHLAAVAAEVQQVLSIDANGPRRLVHAAMQDVSGRGIGSKGDTPTNAQMVQQSPADSTAVLSERGKVGNPTIDETRSLLQSLSSEFDLLVVDLPSLNVTGALEWAPLLDGIVLVVESERVRWQMAARRIGMLEETGAHVLGTVINKRRDYIPSWLYNRL